MSVTIHCPKCSSGLKLPSRKLLGRKGKCPKCQHRFVLKEPEEVELELAEPESPATPQTPQVGTSAKWVPDEPAAPVFSLANDGPVPKSKPGKFPVNEPPAADSSFNFADVATAASAISTESSDAASESVTSRIRNRRKKRRTGPIAVGVGTALLAFCLLGLWWQQNSQTADDAAASKQPPQVNVQLEQETQQLAAENEDAKSISPTHGEPVTVQYMPFTPHLVFHIRPADVWANNRSMKEFIAALGDPGFGRWLHDSILNLTKFEPTEIEELTIGINFGARTATPDVAAVVRLTAEQSEVELQRDRFAARRRPDPTVKMFQTDEFNYLLVDNKTFVVAPAALTDELTEALTFSYRPSLQLESLLKESDRQRQATLLFDVANIDTHREYIFNQDLQTLADQFVLWFGNDVQTVSWSFHLSPEHLYMETLLRHVNDSSPRKVKRYISGQLEDLPQTLAAAVRFMKPPTIGYREMIGRFPAMMKATALGTRSFVGSDHVRLLTFLPRKAAPNLAAASLFTWNQSLVTDFDGPAPVASSGTKLPDKIIDRLQMPVYIDFRGTPLQEALAYIGEEIQTPFDINGDGLKQVALTQNMRQTHNLGEVPAMVALHAIVSNPDYRNAMVLSIDEAAKKIIVTSRPAAEAASLPILDTAPK